MLATIMLKPRRIIHRRAHSDIIISDVDRTDKYNYQSKGSDGQLDQGMSELETVGVERKGGKFVVQGQMKQVVGDLIAVLV